LKASIRLPISDQYQKPT